MPYRSGRQARRDRLPRRPRGGRTAIPPNRPTLRRWAISRPGRDVSSVTRLVTFSPFCQTTERADSSSVSSAAADAMVDGLKRFRQFMDVAGTTSMRRWIGMVRSGRWPPGVRPPVSPTIASLTLPAPTMVSSTITTTVDRLPGPRIVCGSLVGLSPPGDNAGCA